MCLNFGMFGCMSMCIVGWISSFCLMMDILPKEQAALVPSLMFIIELILRTMAIFVKIEIRSYLNTAATANVAAGFLTFLLFALDFRLVLVIIGGLCLPLCNFKFLASLYVLPASYQLSMSTNNASKMMITYALG